MAFWSRARACDNALRTVLGFPRVLASLRRGFSKVSGSESDAATTFLDNLLKDKSKQQAGTVFLVEKLPPISDFGNAQHGPPLLRMFLLDNGLVANLGSNAEQVIGDVESAMLDPRVQQFYHIHKPPSVGCFVQDITEKSSRPIMKVLSVSVLEGRKGEVFVGVVPLGSDKASPVTTRRQSQVLTGYPVDRRASVSSPWPKIKESVKWMWARGHVENRSIELRFAGPPDPLNPLKLPVDLAGISGSDLLQAFGDETQIGSRHFNKQKYVKGALEFVIHGAVVPIFVNVKDAQAASPSGISVSSMISAAAFLALGVSGLILWWFVLRNPDSEPRAESPKGKEDK